MSGNLTVALGNTGQEGEQRGILQAWEPKLNLGNKLFNFFARRRLHDCS